MFRLGLSLFLLATIFTGCSGVTKSIDRNLAKETIGKSYQDVIQEEDLTFNPKYGARLLEKDLNNGSKLYIHVYPYIGAKTNAGLWAINYYKFKTWGFKVVDGIINDWAYGIYEPDGAESFEIFWIEFGFVEGKWFNNIKDNYSSFLETSKGDKIDVW